MPGGYRVEFGSSPRTAASPAGALGNGSFVAAGFTGIAAAGVRASLPVSVTVTPGSTVRSYSQYDEEPYAQFVAATATQFGGVRPTLPQDAKSLTFIYPGLPATHQAMARALPALADDGTVLFDPAPGGYGGSASFTAGLPGSLSGGNLEITPTITSAAPSFDGTTIAADQIDALGAARLVLGTDAHNDTVAELVVRGGATLSAAEIDVAAGAFSSSPGIFVEPGATLSTVGRGPAPVVPTRGPFPTVSYGLTLANGQLGFAPGSVTPNGVVDIGLCAPGQVCALGTASLLSEGSEVIAGNVTLGRAVQFGARSLIVAVQTINLTSQTTRAGGAALPPGFDLTQQQFQTLIAGAPALGLPVLQQLTLIAAQGVNIYGATDLTSIDPASGRSSLGQFVLQTPEINGHGASSATATISTGTFIWTGQASANGAATVGTGTGSGTLDIVADRIVLGYPSLSAGANNLPVPRVLTGFSAVNLTAASEFSTTNDGSLAVYQSQGSYVNGQGFVGVGGNLTITAPLVTGGPGSVLAVTAGGAIALLPPAGGAPSSASTAALGAELDLTASSIFDATAIVLPSGRLAMTATTGDVMLAAGSRSVLAGQATTFFDQVRYSDGGAVVLQSSVGNVTEAAGALIDVSAVSAVAGSLSVTATGRATAGALAGGLTGGNVALLGTLLGGGGTAAAGGSIDLRAATLSDTGFTALNGQLDVGGFSGSRRFDLRTGSLTIGNDATGLAVLRAHAIDVSVDRGTLSVTGSIDASGASPGSIRLAASGDLTLAATAVLDAHGTAAQLDLAGAPIDARNTGSVALAVSGGSNGANVVTGTLVIDAGATIDVAAGGGATCASGACGRVAFDAPRIGAPGSGDVAISVPGPVTILGAGSIAVDAFWNYAPSGGRIVQANLGAGGTTPLDAGAIGLDQINRDNQAFIGAAEPGGTLDATLRGKLAGLLAPGYDGALHLRPGVEITTASPTGTLDVVGDLDLSGLRYASLATDPRTQLTAAYGSGEPGVLVLRAGGDLTITGSINDGFGLAQAGATLQTPDDLGWVLNATQKLLASLVVSPYLAAQAELGAGTRFPRDATLNFALDLLAAKPGKVAALLRAGGAVPVLPGNRPATLQAAVVIPTAFVGTGAITFPGGSYAAGELIPAGTTLPRGAVLGAGVTLPVSAPLNSLVWPAGVPLSALGQITIRQPIPLAAGDVLPAGIIPRLVAPATGARIGSADLRPASGNAQGEIYGALPLLPTSAAADTLSWSLRLVSGADTAAADTRTLQAATQLAAAAQTSGAASGDLVLSDPHYSNQTTRGVSPVAVFSVVRTGTGNLDLLAGGNVAVDSLYGIYTAGSQAADVPAAYDQPRQDSFGPPASASVSVLGKFGATTLGSGLPSYEQLVASPYYQASYPQGGGDLVVSAQGSAAGYVLTDANGVPDSNAVGNWLFRQGGATTPTAWWINFGTYATFKDTNANTGVAATAVDLIGFTGFGALGGGNVTISAGGEAGYGLRDVASGRSGFASSSAIDAAIGSTGRVSGSAVATTGGGDIAVTVAGSLNAIPTLEAINASALRQADRYRHVHRPAREHRHRG